MLKNKEYRILIILGVISLLLVGLNIGIYFGNRSLTASVNARQQYIQQSVAIGNFRQELARTLAELAVKNHDEQVRNLLAGEGITISQNQSSAPGPADAAKRGK